MSNESKCPVHLQKGVDRYVNERLETGGFLRAVLENDLTGALNHADPESRECLYEVWDYVNETVPPQAWGGRMEVLNWLTGRTPK